MTKKSIGDINPQFMKMMVEMDTINTFKEVEYKTPIIPVIAGNMALVMEILKVFVNNSLIDLDATSPLSNSTLTVQMTRSSQESILAEDDEDLLIPRMDKHFIKREVGTSVTSHSELLDDKFHYFDLTDGNGNGIIFSGRSLYLGILTGNLGTVVSAGVWVLYRLVKVDMKEFLGELLD